MNYQFSVNVRSNEHAAKSHEHDIRDDSDSAEDDHSFYPSRPPTVSYYGLPYLDHTYGAPWPPSPPPPVVAAPLVVPRINGHIDIDNVSYHAEVCTTAVDLDPANQYADSVTRCICGFQHDDGYMICCDKCGVWQHVDCMGVEREHIPEVYLCEMCQPRFVDKRKAMVIQRKRYELLTGAVDVEAVDVGDDVPQLPLARDLLSNMVPLAPLSPHPHPHPHPGPRPHQAHVKMLQRNVQLSTGHKPVYRPKFHRGHRKVMNGAPARQRSNGKYSTDEDFDDDEGRYAHYRGRNGTVDKSREMVNVAELPAHCNTYSGDVAALLRAHRHLNGQQQQQLLTWQSISEKLLPLSRHLCRAVHVAANTKGLQVLEDVETSRPLIEYTGSVKIDDDDCVFSSKRLQPFVLIYAKFESARLRIESGATDTDAKFVRRSCKPNAEIRHLSDNSAVRLFVFSSRPIFRGQEITIPYDMDYSESETYVCGCGRDPCPMLKSTRRLSRSGRRKKSERENVELSVDVSEDEDAKLAIATGGRRRRQDSGLDAHPQSKSPPSPTNGSNGTLGSRRRASDEDPASRNDAQVHNDTAPSRRRKKSLVSSDDDTTVAVKVEDVAKQLDNKTKRAVERRVSISEKAKPAAEKEEKKPKVTLEHSISCTSPVKEGVDNCFNDRRMSREERKLEAIMKAFERLEQQQTVKRRDSVSKVDGKVPGKVEVKEEIKEVEKKRTSPAAAAAARIKKTLDSRKPAVKKMNGRRRPWLTLKRSTSKSSNTSAGSNRRSPVRGGPRVTSITAPCTPLVDTPSTGQLAGMPFKFPKTKKEWTSRGEQRRSLGGGDSERAALGVGDAGEEDEEEDMDKYVSYVQTPTRHLDMLKNVRRTSASSGSSKGSPASLYLVQQQQTEFGAGSAKKRWLRQVMHETGDGDGASSVQASTGAVSLASPHQSPAVERVTPLKKRRFTRESVGDESETLLSLANSVPAMEYEQLEKSKAAGDLTSAAVNLTPSLDSDVADNLFERFSAQRRLTLAEQLLALRGSGGVEMEGTRSEVPDASSSSFSAAAATADVAGGDTKPDDGMLLLLQGIEQAAARERANSLQPVDSCALPLPSATSDADAVVSDDSSHQRVGFADDGIAFSDNSLSISAFDSSAIGLLAELSETVLQPVAPVTDKQLHLLATNVAQTMLVAETVVDGYHGHDSREASHRWTFTERTSFTVEDTPHTGALTDTDSNSGCDDHVAGIGSSSQLPHERKKVSLGEYRSRMRERSLSTQTKLPVSPSPADCLGVALPNDAESLADETCVADGGIVKQEVSGEWSAEATAVERQREHSSYHGQHWLSEHDNFVAKDEPTDKQAFGECVGDQSTKLFPATSDI